MKRIYIIATIIVALAGIVSMSFVLTPSDIMIGQRASGHGNGLSMEEMGQEDIINDLTARLRERGVPVVFVQMIKDDRMAPPIVVKFVLQSSSESDQVAPEDPIYSNVVGHVVNLAQKRGLQAGAIGVTILNTKGEVLSSTTRVTQEKEDISSRFDQPYELDNDTVATLLRQRLPLYGMSLQKIEVSLDDDGTRWAIVDIRVPDIEVANAGIASFMWKTRITIEELNLDEKTQTAIYQINLSTPDGEPLLKYVNDLQLGRESWWQVDELDKNWFPHPPLEE